MYLAGPALAQLDPKPIWISDLNGCKVIDPTENPARDVLVSWTGKCIDGYMDGAGVLAIPARATSFKGELAQGRFVRGELRVGALTFVGSFAPEGGSSEGTWTNADGTTMKGVFITGKRLQEVEMIWTDGARYQGEIDFATARREGRGKQWDADGSFYEGPFRNHEPHGQGVKTFSNGAVYAGDFVAGERTGKARQTFLTGDVYEGDFVSGSYQGKGRLEYANGASYEGDFVYGKRQGHGKSRGADGSLYEGSFLSDDRHGHGKLITATGDVYEGDFVNNRYQGQGELRLAGGASYVGSFVAGQPHGRGRFAYPNGGIYDGEFVNGQRQGSGKYLEGEMRQEGEWIADMLDGRCEVEFTAKYWYDGECTAGRLAGSGHLEDRVNDVTYDGTLRDGRKEGFGKEVHGNGLEYEGEFSRDAWHGSGTMRSKSSTGDAIEYKGSFVYGKMEGKGSLVIGSTRMEGEFVENSLQRGRIQTGSGRTFEVDRDKGILDEILPDGSTRRPGAEELQELGI